MTRQYVQSTRNIALWLVAIVIVVGPTRYAMAQESAGLSGILTPQTGTTNPGTQATGTQMSEPPKSDRTLAEFRKAMKSKSGGMGGLPQAGMGMSSMGSESGGGMGTNEKQLLAQLIQRLNDRLSSKKHNRELVEKQLRTALKQFFDADMEERVKELDKVKASLAEMELKLERRLASDQEIVELQLKKMLHKADGLDFSIPTDDFGGSGYGSGGMMGGEGYGSSGGGALGEMGAGGEGAEGGMPGMGGRGMGAPGGFGSGMAGGMGSGSLLPGGVTPGGMTMGSGGSGTVVGSIDLNNAQNIGYDASFGLTRILRLDDDQLEELDPLNSYAETFISSSEKFRKGLEKMSNAEKLLYILVCFRQFEERFHHLPRSANHHTKNQPPHSWRVAILPLIGYTDLYSQYKFDQPWDSPDNLRLASQMPEIYRSAISRMKDTTPFKMLVGSGAIDSSITPPRMADITDGTSNTIALIESASDDEVVWTKPEDVNYDLNTLFKLAESRLVGFADGRVKVLPKDLEASQLRAMVTRAGGEVVTLP